MAFLCRAAAQAWAAKCSRTRMGALPTVAFEDRNQQRALLTRLQDGDCMLHQTATMCSISAEEGSEAQADPLQLNEEARQHMAEVARVAEATSGTVNAHGGAWKWAIRRRIWDLLEQGNIAMHARPVHHRILNCTGFLTAASQQISLWEAAKSLRFQDSHFNKSVIRLARKPSNMLNAQVREISTYKDTGDSAEKMNPVFKVHSSYKKLGRLSRGKQQKSRHTRAKSRCASKEEVEVETHSGSEKYSQSKCNPVAQDDLDGPSEDMSDVVDSFKELGAIVDASDTDSGDDVKGNIFPQDEGNLMDVGEELEATTDASDMDSDDDGARVITPSDIFRGVEIEAVNKLPEKEQEKVRRKMMDQLIGAALDEPEEVEDGQVQEDEQRSLRVGIIGAVNAGKSSLTNFMVGTKVAAVSRKRNTTLTEILGVVTKGKTQILLYDTPGLVLDILGKPSKTDTRRRSESAWQLFSHCEVLLVLVDAYRQIHKPDKRVLRLVERLGEDEESHLKKALVFNKVDIVENKKQLLPLAQQFGELPGYESIFMVSALTGSGVKDIVNYLTDRAVLRPWEEEPNPLNEETTRTLSMEVVREHLLDRVHEEIPYELDHQLVDWQELEDGSLRIEQHFYFPKKGQCRIVVGKGGSKIREIGIKACEELRKLLDRKVHLFLEVKHGGGF